MASGRYRPKTGQLAMLFVPLLGELLSSLARIEPISGKRMILETEPDEASKSAFFDIQNTNRVVLLKRHPRGFRVMRNRTVFRLEVLRQRSRWVHICGWWKRWLSVWRR